MTQLGVCESLENSGAQKYLYFAGSQLVRRTVVARRHMVRCLRE